MWAPHLRYRLRISQCLVGLNDSSDASLMMKSFETPGRRRRAKVSVRQVHIRLGACVLFAHSEHGQDIVVDLLGLWRIFERFDYSSYVDCVGYL